MIKKKKEQSQESLKNEKNKREDKFLKVKATKNSNLLSFGEPEEEDEEFQVKFKAVHDKKRKKNDVSLSML